VRGDDPRARPTPPVPPSVPPRVLLAAGLRLVAAGVLIAEEHDGRLRIVWATPAVDRMLGLEPGAAIGVDLHTVVVRRIDGPTDAEEVLALAEAITDGDGGLVVSLRPLGGPDGRPRPPADGPAEVGLPPGGPPVAVRVAATRVEDDQRSAWVATLTEIDEQVRADARLRESEERFRTLAAQAPIGIVVSDVGLRLGFVNDRAVQLWDRPVEVMRSPRWLDAIVPDDREQVVTALAGVLAGGEADVGLRTTTADGRIRELRLRAAPVRLDGRGAGFIASLEDVTAQRRHEAELRDAALHDPLTHLPNRAMLDQVLEDAIGRRRDDGLGALLFFDLDDFKGVNDRFGHAAGDEVLVTVAERLSAALREDVVLARYGGDEFVVLCRRLVDADAAAGVAERMRARLAQPIRVGGTDILMDVSVGVAVLDASVTRPGELLRDADTAMYQAKRSGRARVVVFREDDRQREADRAALAADLREVVDAGALALAWQPVVDPVARRVHAVEALLRWPHPLRGHVPADEVVSLAEEQGLLAPVGEQVLRQACAQLADWRVRVPALVTARLCVNVARQQVAESLPDLVTAALRGGDLDPEDLVLDVSEAALTHEVASLRTALPQLRELGVGLAVDDFGAGAASLSTLVALQPSMVKVDRSVTARVDRDAEARRFLAAAVDIGRAVGAVVVAEGVESPAQLEAVLDAGCTLAQGYLLVQPRSPEGLEEDLADGGWVA
jgi:diguanylate cyclase (GGDEF)-like protein/PAS domain S-box-containing protein